MKNNKYCNFLILLAGLTFSLPKIQANTDDTIWWERRQANVIDATVFTIAAKVVNDFFLQNPDKLPLLKSLGYGAGAWLGGEACETIYKKIFKLLAKKNLRDVLGTTDILGVKIDNQRLLRRTITLIALCIALKHSA